VHFAGQTLPGLIKYNFLTVSVLHYPLFAPQIAYTFQHCGDCTFCADCAETVLKGVCPNCGGNFSPRPIRPAHMLLKHPASTKRVVKDGGCLKRAS
jgi:hypothetical protein